MMPLPFQVENLGDSQGAIEGTLVSAIFSAYQLFTCTSCSVSNIGIWRH